MAEYRDPKVTKAGGSNMGKWIGIALAVLLALLLLGWLLGAFDSEEAEVDTVVDPAVTEEPVEPVVVE